MKKTFIENAFVRSPRFMNAMPGACKAWLLLSAFSAERLSDGVVYGAAEFTNQTWGWLIGRGGGRRAVDQMVTDRLAFWHGSDLILIGYDHAAEAAYLAKIEAAGKGGSAPRRPKAPAPGTQAPPDRFEVRENGGGEGSRAPASALSTPEQNSLEEGGEEPERGVPPSETGRTPALGATPLADLARLNLQAARQAAR